MAKPIKITFLGDASSVQRAYRSIEQGASRVQKKIAGVSQGFSNAGRSMRNVGKSMSLGVTAPIVGGLVAATKAAIDERAEMAQLANTMRNTVGATDAGVQAMEDWVTATQNATGVSDGELRPALAKMMLAGQSAAEAQDTVSTAMDIAAARGLSLEAVTKALARGAQGSTTGLGRLGLATKDAAGEALSFEEIMASANDTYGGAAQAAAETTAGKMQILKVRFDDMMEDVGNAFIPIMEKAVGWISKAATWFSNLSPKVQQIGIVVALAVAALGPLVYIFGALATAIGFILSPVGLVILAIVAVVAAVVLAYRRFEGFRNVVQSVVEWLVQVAWPAIQRFAAVIVEAFGEAVAWVQNYWPQISEAIGHVWNVIRTIIMTGVDFVMMLWRAWGDDLLNIVSRVWNMISGMIAAALQIIRGVIQLVVSLINGDWGAAWEAVKGIVAGVWNYIYALIAGVLGVLSSLIAGTLQTIAGIFSGIWNGIYAVVAAVITGVYNFVRDKVGGIVGWVTGIPGRLLGAAGSFLSAGVALGGKIIDGIRDGVAGAVSFAGDMASKVWEKIKDFVNSHFIDPIRGFEVSAFGLSVKPFSAFPRLAMGGTTSRDGIAIVGERGPEAAFLPRGTRVTPAHSATLGQSVVVNVATNADPYQIARAVAWAMKTDGR